VDITSVLWEPIVSAARVLLLRRAQERAWISHSWLKICRWLAYLREIDADYKGFIIDGWIFQRQSLVLYR